jgi:hypothetical protein
MWGFFKKDSELDFYSILLYINKRYYAVIYGAGSLQEVINYGKADDLVPISGIFTVRQIDRL